MFRNSLRERIVYGWPLVPFTCSYCKEKFLSSELFGLKLIRGEFKKCCCENKSCISTFLNEEE